MNICKGVSLLLTGVILSSSLSFASSGATSSMISLGGAQNQNCEVENIIPYDIPLSSGGNGISYIKHMSNDVSSVNGLFTSKDSNIVIDSSTKNAGYIKVKCKNTKRIKLKVVSDTREYIYDLNNKDKYETFPLQMGDGEYTVKVMQQIVDNRYTCIYNANFDVKLKNSNAPFLVPSQYVNYTSSSNAVKKVNEICRNKKTDVSKLNAIYDYVIKNIDYDSKKAKTVQQGYIPAVDQTLKTKKGICFDYACLLAAMLRSQNIPTRLVIGTVSPKDLNHAWNEVYLKDKGWVTVKVYFDGNQWKRMDATFGSSNNKNIESFIGDADNYTSIRVY